MSTARPFTPTREDPAVLARRMVGADAAAVLDRIVRRIEAAGDGNLAHTLVVGPRGSGKTHMLAVARHQAEQRTARIRSVVVPEDAHGIVTFVELLRLVAGSLGVDLAALDEASRDVGRLEGAIREQVADGVLVLVVENLDRLFAKLRTAGQHDLRAWVETSRKVLVLASSPLLFDGVRDRDQPWFGSFTTEYLADLNADEGSQLLLNLRAGDPDLIAFLGTPSGRARVQALHHLTGGSPRLWTIFADVVTVDLLDELVPAVERLLEELVTYYQQRLWDLGPNEERVVTALASGPASRTATQLAEELGLDQRTIGTTMGRLSDARVVRGRKLAGTDQRTTWYELREPLLRHYLQYRTDSRRELTLIIEMLRYWFDPTALEGHLLRVAPGSEAERYIGASLNLERPIVYDDAYETHTADGLLLQARRWINDPDAAQGLAEAGVVIEGVLGRLGVGCGERATSVELRELAESVPVPTVEATADGIVKALDALADSASGRLADVFGWLAASWRIESDEAEASRRLEALQRTLTADDDVLAVHVAHDLAYVRALTDAAGALEELQDVLVRRRVLQGDNHPDTLVARSNLAFFTGEAGDTDGALALYRELLPDQLHALGPRHRGTLVSRSMIAYFTAETGDVAGALALYREILPDQLDALGPRDRDTLVTRGQIAYLTGETGDAAGALALYREILPDQLDALGPRDRDTLVTRGQIAYFTGETGDAAGALALYRELLPDRVDALGPRDGATLVTRGQIAYFTGETGDAAGALALYRELLPDRVDALGPRHRDTLVTRGQIAYFTGETGDAAGALALYREILPDQLDALGPRDRDTLITRGQIAYFTGATGDAAGALALYRELLPDRVDALGPRDRDTLITRSHIAWLELAAGQAIEALMSAWHLMRACAEAGARDHAETLAGPVLAASLVEVLTRQLTRDVPDEIRQGVFGDLLDAAEGSTEALSRLPAEMRELVESTSEADATGANET